MQKSRQNFPKFYDKHVISWSYLQMWKCDDAACPHHKPPLRGQETISAFPDHVPSKVYGVLHYHEGVDPPKKPSVVNVKFLVKNEKNQGWYNQGWYIRSWNWKKKSHRKHKKWWRHCLTCTWLHLLSIRVPGIEIKSWEIFFYVKIFYAHQK